MTESEPWSAPAHAEVLQLDACLHELAGVVPAPALGARIVAACERAAPDAAVVPASVSQRWWWAAALVVGLGAIGAAAWWRTERHAVVAPVEATQDPAQQSSLTQQIGEQWRRSIEVLADTKAADDATTMQAARSYAEGKMTEDIAARVATQLRVHMDDVRALWAGRAEVQGGKRTATFGYGVGSWVLGEARILEGTKPGEANAGGAQPKDRSNGHDVERIARALREAMERRRAAVQAAGAEPEEQTEEGWWRAASPIERSSWLCAYYAEFGGQLVVTASWLSPCVACDGEGMVPDVGTGGRLVRKMCFLCQGTKWLRSFEAY